MDDYELLGQFSRLFRTVANAYMDRIDLHRAQAFLLCRLYDQDGMTQSEIGEQLSVQGATVTNMLQRMEETGLIVRRRDPQDNRLVRVYLTGAGREKERSINSQFEELEAMIFEGISPEERATLRQILRRLSQNMSDNS
jgi:DNA-binding MarR family transcriptional regulator